MDVTQIIIAVFGLLTTIVTVFVIPLLKQKVGAEKWGRLMQIIMVVVDAAEQLGITGQIENKFDYALKQTKILLEAQGLSYDEETISIAIESFVQQINSSATMAIACNDLATEIETKTFTDAFTIPSDESIVEMRTTVKHADGSIQEQRYLTGVGVTFDGEADLIDNTDDTENE